MALPGITMTIEDGALGTLPPNTAGASAKIGICSKGAPSTFSAFSDEDTLKAALGAGPLVEAIAQVLNEAGGPVYACPATPTTAGTAGVSGTGGGSTHVGTGTGTLAVSLAPDRVVLMKVAAGGTRGTATVQFSIDGGAYGAPVLTAATLRPAGAPLTVLSLATGTYVLNEIYTVATSGVVSQSGSGPAVTQASSPVDAYDVIVEITTAGGLGVGAFIYSVDGGNNVSPNIAIPGSGVYTIPGTGLVLTFAGTFVDDDTYSFTSVPAAFTVSDVNTALDFIGAQSVEWDHVHIVGAPATAAATATLATAVDTKLTGFETAFRYTYAVVECPSTESDATIAAALASFSSRRVAIAVGDAGVISPLTGKNNRRNAAWLATARIAKISPEEDPAWVGRGALTGVTSLYRNEEATPFLDEARFITLRTMRGRAGYYITNFRLMAPGGSDFTYGMNRRVMDTACRITRQAELNYVNQAVAIDPTTGFIDEKEAQRFEADVNSQLRAGIVAPGMASSARVVMSRTANLLAGASAPVTVRLVPDAYLKHIDTSMGFSNPAIG
jgi:hypothetical protein